MWFGDLVTMKWWNGIWLNEAFATFMEVNCVDAYRPEWERWVSFSTGRAAAMGVDGLAATRPVEFPVVSPDDAEGMFDLLTYEKGGALLRMLETYLGSDRFRDGIRHYLRTHAYANTETTDLWDALEATTGEPVRAMMDTWIFQGGHPEVSVSEAADRSSLMLGQRRFRYSPSPADTEVRWHVPVVLRASTGGNWTRHRALLTEASATVALGSAADMVVVNDGGWGFFRTRYDSALLARLTVDIGALTATERFNLVSDTWSAVLAGRTPVREFLTLVSGLTDENDDSVWTSALRPLDLLDRIADGDRAEVATFVARLVSPAFERIGWEPRSGQGERTGSLRSTLLNALGTIGGREDVQARARALHASYIEDRAAVAPDIVDALVAIVAWTGSEADYETFRERSINAATPQEEVRYLFALPGFREERLMKRTLDLALTEIRTQNAPFVVARGLANRWCGSLAWAWLESHWDEVLERFPNNTTAPMLEGLAALNTPELRERIHRFMASHPVPHAQRLIDQTLEHLDVRTAFRDREAAGLGEVLNSFS
jgi:puromycin-sensitive aminopeptidase